MQVFKASTGTIAGVCFTPDGRQLVTGAYPRVILWDVTGAPKPVRQFDSDGHAMPAIVSPCGRFLAHWGNALRLFDLTNPSVHPITRLELGRLTMIAFAPDSTEFAAPAFTPRQWAVPSWKVIRDRTPSRALGLESTFATGAVAYTPDGRFVAISFAVFESQSQPPRYDSHIRLFDRVTGERARDLRIRFQYAHPSQIAFSPDGSVLAGNFGPVLCVVSVADGREVARIKTGTKHITALAFTPDGTKCVAVSNDTRVRVFDARAWTETTGYEWKIGPLRCVAVAPDGLRMAAGSCRGKVVIWDVDG